MMLLPRYREFDVRLRLARLPAKEPYVLLYPLENIKGYETPKAVVEEFTEMEILTKGAGGDVLPDMIAEKVTNILNSNALAWCAHGATVTFERSAYGPTYRLTVKPYATDSVSGVPV